jgi:hypothetical protein
MSTMRVQHPVGNILAVDIEAYETAHCDWFFVSTGGKLKVPDSSGNKRRILFLRIASLRDRGTNTEREAQREHERYHHSSVNGYKAGGISCKGLRLMAGIG